MAIELAVAYINIIPSFKNLSSNLRPGMVQVENELAGAGQRGGIAAGTKFSKGMESGVKGTNLTSAMNTTGTQAANAAGTHGQRAGTSFGQKMMSGFLAVGVAGMVVGSIKGAVDAYMQSAVDVNALKRLTGGGTEDTSRLSTELTLSGVASDKASTAMKLFSKSLGTAAADAGKTADMAAKLGVSFTNADGSVKPLTDLMGPLADKFQSMPNGAEKTALAMQLFGRSGTDMLPFLNKGAAGLEELGKKSDEFGLTLTDTSIGAMGDAKQKAREFDASIQGMKISLGEALLPVMTTVQQFIRSYLIPVFKDVGQFIQDNTTWLMPLVAGGLALFSAFKVGTVIMGAFNAVMDANPIILVGIAIAALVAGVIYAYNNFDWFKNGVQTAWDVIQNAATFAWGVIQPIFNALWAGVQALGAVFMWLWANVIQPVWDVIQNAISFAWNNVISPVFNALWAGVQALGAVFSWLWANVVQPVWDVIQNAISFAWNNVIAPLFEVAKFDIQLLGAVFSWLWANVIQPVWDAIQNIITFAWNNVISPMFGYISGGINTLGGVFSWLWNNVVQPAWDGIGNIIGGAWNNVISPAFEAIKTGVSKVGDFFSTVKDGIGVAWNMIKDIVAAPIKWVIDTVWNNGIVPVWEKIDSWLPGDLPKLDRLTLAFAGGGVVPGYAPGHDTVNAVLSPGEAVLVPELTRSLLASGVDILGANKAARAGGNGLQYFADGGFFDNIWPDDITGMSVAKTQVSPTGDITGPNVIGDLASFTSGFMSDPLGTFMGMLGSGVSNGIKSMAESPWGNAIAQLPGQAIKGVIDAIKSALPSVGGAYGPSSVSGDLNLSQNPGDYGWPYPAKTANMSWGGKGLTIASGTEGLWSGLLDNLNANIQGGITSIGGYEDRANVNNPSAKSLHAYGLAVDVNPEQNPNGVNAYGRVGPGVIPSSLAPAIARQFGMIWGGDFTGTPDGMHFEIHVSPGQIGAAVAGAAAAPDPGGSGVERWRGTVMQALGITGLAPGFANYVLHQMDTESSGNPAAINLTDSNARAGIPSKGLMQVIDPTFRSYAMAPYNQNIYDPLSNIIASIKYVMARYGNIPAGMRGVAYDNGGWLQPGGMGRNFLKKPEAVLTPDQSKAYQTHAESLAAGYGGSAPDGRPNVTIGDVHIAQGGPQELLDEVMWRARAMVGR